MPGGRERARQGQCGAWVFTGTRLPVAALFENLESGATVKDFVEWFDGAEEGKVRAVLQHVADSLKAPVPVDGIRERTPAWNCIEKNNPR